MGENLELHPRERAKASDAPACNRSIVSGEAMGRSGFAWSAASRNPKTIATRTGLFRACEPASRFPLARRADLVDGKMSDKSSRGLTVAG
jgi:hypothetical protein